MHSDPVISLCQQGIAAAVAGRRDLAAALYRQAWDAHSDAYQAAVAAHYIASLEADPHQALHWHSLALERAQAADARVQSYFPSLWLNLGKAHQDLGAHAEARDCYQAGLSASDALPDQGMAALLRPALQARLKELASIS